MNTILFPSANSQAICELAERRLRESPYFFLRRISCQFSGGVLTLRGRVPYNRLRGFAEGIVARLDGVQSIDNQVEVCDPWIWANDPGRRASA
jgi:hypothetical protein